jgi:hypothetical protein
MLRESLLTVSRIDLARASCGVAQRLSSCVSKVSPVAAGRDAQKHFFLRQAMIGLRSARQGAQSIHERERHSVSP